MIFPKSLLPEGSPFLVPLRALNAWGGFPNRKRRKRALRSLVGRDHGLCGAISTLIAPARSRTRAGVGAPLNANGFLGMRLVHVRAIIVVTTTSILRSNFAMLANTTRE